MVLLAALAAGLAVALLLPPRRRLVVGPRRAGSSIGPLAVAALAVPLGLGTRTAVTLVVLTLAGSVALLLWRRRRQAVAAHAVSLRVLESCELLRSELAAGRPAGVALDRAAREWPELTPVARAWHLGSDVPGALRAVARADGAGDLRLLAAAWQVAHRSGQGLGTAVAAIADDLVAEQATRRVVDSELASARATARLVAVLPVPVLLMGGSTGTEPWGFLLGTGVGLACLAGGLAFLLAGLWWVETIARSVRQEAVAR